ncbi:BlaI/MecI/CopY family transcriptional regulator [Streptomyces sp. H27-C3]|uniref:BlaI/MecI/CopY family transcriptional regulator n=1 Tax=Streptomyces sp. H27-C3 TaxID=3046305 RepID=UPI0024BA4550|nr:BlaI/MecI/CopY family transcriptional regulator [Streptomyces sp. H27-C3]MDJ0465617.1 BlaI/MecI/CopY family transcriptional regulator [Streptomyces sp. H27-C3]
MSGDGSKADRGREPRGRRRGQGELEAQVLSVLGTAQEPVTAAWVQGRLDGDLAYTTVITILTRLYEKKAVTRSSEGRPIRWEPVADGAGLTALRMRSLLDKRDDRDAVLSSFVSALSPDDEHLLRSLLGEARRQVGLGGRARGAGQVGPGDPDES